MKPEDEFFDGDDLLARREEESLFRIPCPKAREAARERRRFSEEIAVCETLRRSWQVRHGMEVDPTALADGELSNIRRITLCYAAALEGVGRRDDGVDALRLYLGVGKERFRDCPDDDDDDDEERLPPNQTLDVSAALALAKLYFKANRKKRAFAWCDAILSRLRKDANCCPPEDISDAYHLAGWIRIHSDDHTGAYRLWTEGHDAVPECDALARQHRKRACWDDDGADHEEVTDPSLLGGGEHGDGAFAMDDDLDAFAVPAWNVARTPALALFCAETQGDALVFRTRRPVLTAAECARVLEEVDSFHDDCRGGEWGTVRHSSVKTTDVAVEGEFQHVSWGGATVCYFLCI